MEDGDLTGAILDGRYRVIEPVAEGAMGVVYRAERLKLGRIVAIKVLHDVLPNELSARRRFDIEATAMAKLEHPHCASVLDVGVHDDRPFVVMEFVSGDNLKDVIGHGPLPVGRAIEIVRQVLSGLAHAHEHGIIHRDIKPANLVLSHKTGLGDHVKILDFGLARLHNTGQNLTSGMVVGTPAYMAPEQIRGQLLDHRIDLYACGVLLFELITGEKPYHSETDDPIEVCRLHLSAPIPRLGDKLPGVAFGDLEAVVTRALAKSADYRYSSAHDFAAALDAFVPARASRTPRSMNAATPAPSGSIQLASADVMPVSDASAAAARNDRPELLGTFLGIAVPRTTPVPRMPRAADTPSPFDAAVPAAPALGGSPAAHHGSTVSLGDARAVDAIAPPPASTTGALRPAGRARRWLILGAVLAVAAGIGLVATRDQPAAVDEATAGSAAPAPSPVDPANDIVARANELAAKGDRDGAIDVLVRARKQAPDSAPLAYAAGRMFFAKYYWADGLKSFRDALRLEPTYRTDPELIKIVLRGFIMTPSYNDDLASFLREDIGGPAQGFLEETARDHPNASVRSRAASELRRYR